MKKGSHIETDFINFILEKYSPQSLKDKKKKSKIEEEEEGKDLDKEEETEEFEDDKEDDQIIEKLVNEYKKIKKEYERYRIQNRWK